MPLLYVAPHEDMYVKNDLVVVQDRFAGRFTMYQIEERLSNPSQGTINKFEVAKPWFWDPDTDLIYVLREVGEGELDADELERVERNAYLV